MGHRPFRQIADELRVDEDADLINPGGKGRWNDHAEELTDARRHARPTQPQADASRTRGPPGEGELDHTADDNRNGQCLRTCRTACRHKEQRGEHDNVEQSRCKCSCREFVHGVQHARIERDEADQHQIGEGEAGEPVGQLKLSRIACIARSEEPDQSRHGELADDREGEQRRQKDCEHFFGELFRFLQPAFAMIALAE